MPQAHKQWLGGTSIHNPFLLSSRSRSASSGKSSVASCGMQMVLGTVGKDEWGKLYNMNRRKNSINSNEISYWRLEKAWSILLPVPKMPEGIMRSIKFPKIQWAKLDCLSSTLPWIPGRLWYWAGGLGSTNCHLLKLRSDLWIPSLKADKNWQQNEEMGFLLQYVKCAVPGIAETWHSQRAA